MLINVDFDGVLIPNDFEKRLVLEGNKEGYTKISQFSGALFDWYIKFVNTSPIPPINVDMLRWLSGMKDNGHHIRLWTNRNVEIVNKTIRTLGDWTSIFDSFHFFSGRKSSSKVEGIAIDNSLDNLQCAEVGGIHYEWR